MKVSFMTAALFLLLIFFSPYNYSQWVRTNGPGYTNGFAGNGTILFAAAGGGVFKTTNYGDNWINTGVPSTSITAVAINGFDVYAGSGTGSLYKSSDLGVSWVALNLNDHDLKINTIDFIQVFNNKVFVGKSVSFANTTILYASTDGGLTWFNSGLGLPDFNAYCMVERGSDLFVTAGSWNGAGVYHSSTGGLNWSYTGLPYGMCYLSLSNEKLYAGSYNSGIFGSSDNGVNWNDVTSDGLPNIVYSLIADGVDNLYSGVYNNGIYFLVNNGNSWISISEGLSGASIHNSLFTMQPYIYTGMTDGYVYRRSLSEITSMQNNRNIVPGNYSLYQNYPNPFNPSTKISYDLPSVVNVKLVIYDILGSEVKTLVNEKQNAGRHEIEFNAANYPSGVYYYKLSAGDYISSRKMVLVK